MTNSRYFLHTLCAATLLTCVSPAFPAETKSPPADVAPTDPAELVAVLKSDAPQPQKAAACKYLARVGGRDAVPVLAPLLADERLSHAARMALQEIPDAAAGKALCDALATAKGQQLVGVINSVGVRRDRKGSEALVRLLYDSDAAIAAASAAALSRLATPEATAAIENALAKAPEAQRASLADALLASAQAMRAERRNPEAADLYDRLWKLELPRHIRLAAARGAILANQELGTDLLVTRLLDADDGRFVMALGASDEMPGRAVTSALLQALPKLPNARQALLIGILAQRADPTALPAVLKAAKSDAVDVRAAAIRALATLGDAAAIPLLLESLDHADQEIAASAQQSLSTMKLAEVDAAIVAKIASAKGPSRRLLLELVGGRRITAAAEILAKAADDSDSGIRLAALQALATTCELAQLPVLTRHLLASKGDDEKTAAHEALKKTCSRLAGMDACAKHLASCMNQASTESKPVLIELLGAVGGPAAVQTVSAAACNTDPTIQYTATRVLGEWPSPEAAPVLIELARTMTEEKYALRMLRGYIRIIRQMDLSDRQKSEMCREAMAAARRDEERLLVIEAAGRIKSSDALEMVVSHLSSAKLREAAAKMAVTIGGNLPATDAEAVSKAMQQVLQATKSEDTKQRANDVLKNFPSATSKHL